MIRLMRKIVWVAVLWVVVTALFPEVANSLPPPLLWSSYMVAGALIVTGREQFLLLAWLIGDALVAPLYALYWLLKTPIEVVRLLVED